MDALMNCYDYLIILNDSMGFTLHQHGHTHGGGGGHSHFSESPSSSSIAGDDSQHILENEATNSDKNGIIDNDVKGYGSVNGTVADNLESSELGEGHGHNHSEGSHGDNINVKAAFIHVVGDLIQSIGVLIAAIIIFVKVR